MTEICIILLKLHWRRINIDEIPLLWQHEERKILTDCNNIKFRQQTSREKSWFNHNKQQIYHCKISKMLFMSYRYLHGILYEQNTYFSCKNCNIWAPGKQGKENVQQANGSGTSTKINRSWLCKCSFPSAHHSSLNMSWHHDTELQKRHINEKPKRYDYITKLKTNKLMVEGIKLLFLVRELSG